ncbi:phosphoribosylformylglycinamidine synthase subunit I [Mucilaginibacter gossypiicola]|uniref:Phosphoribosylformylglycinamidine synthase subunit PurQ n=1 Tax=Mucilaginibacter gossypiicola TaxID=551995 RepID=A0A1H8SLQ8_9SPHI|nr:phosphoribosylformylglycinamidine synthase subunit PurQ [Mucilaginibacter gossypiicola]SEO79133.1 phosphoribosylformylglycinamidine synthase subunit I [Mucilaginibacter gossypiicola]
MKFGVVIFPGSNCDEDIICVLEKVLSQQVVRLWHKDHDLQGVDFVVLPGGFSFGDYLRSGAISRFSPIMQEVIQFAAKGGYVMGICNGFQILTEAGLLPGALLHNTNRKFICRNIYLKPQTSNSLLTAQLDPQQALRIPIAHGEGNYFADAEVIKALNDNDQVMFRYCDEAGNITADANPNGSLENIAGVTNLTRNVFGLMPHPERAADGLLANEDGLAIFESILSIVRA